MNPEEKGHGDRVSLPRFSQENEPLIACPMSAVRYAIQALRLPKYPTGKQEKYVTEEGHDLKERGR